MRNIDNIISEEIDRFIFENTFNENFFMERKKKKKSKSSKKKESEGKRKTKSHRKKGGNKDSDIRKLVRKLRGGLRGDFDVKSDKLTNPNLNNQDSKDLADVLDSPYINLAAVARDAYTDHTPEGAQSQLRKKVKNLKSDSGSRYRIKKKEADRIRKSLLKNLNMA